MRTDRLKALILFKYGLWCQPGPRLKLIHLHCILSETQIKPEYIYVTNVDQLQHDLIHLLQIAVFVYQRHLSIQTCVNDLNAKVLINLKSWKSGSWNLVLIFFQFFNLFHKLFIFNFFILHFKIELLELLLHSFVFLCNLVFFKFFLSLVVE